MTDETPTFPDDTYDDYIEFNLHMIELMRTRIYASYPDLDQGEAEIVATAHAILTAHNHMKWPEDKKEEE